MDKKELYEIFGWSNARQSVLDYDNREEKKVELTKQQRIKITKDLLKNAMFRRDYSFAMAVKPENKKESDFYFENAAYWSDEVLRLQRKLNNSKITEKFDLETIKAIDIKDLFIDNGCKLISCGNKRFKTACPFHKEKTASCVIYEEQNSFYCFGCQNGGSVIDFVMKIRQLTFYRACAYLNNNYL